MNAQPRWLDILWRHFFEYGARRQNEPAAALGRHTVAALVEMVPGDRIELPTRGFSIPCSTD